MKKNILKIQQHKAIKNIDDKYSVRFLAELRFFTKFSCIENKNRWPKKIKIA